MKTVEIKHILRKYVNDVIENSGTCVKKMFKMNKKNV